MNAILLALDMILAYADAVSILLLPFWVGPVPSTNKPQHLAPPRYRAARPEEPKEKAGPQLAADTCGGMSFRGLKARAERELSSKLPLAT